MIESSALFSNDNVFRYVLTRKWSSKSKMCAFIGLNPSTADQIRNDPTVTRCIHFAHDLGYGGMIMLNIFAFRSTDPNMLYKVSDPIGPHNDFWIKSATEGVDMVIGAWGNHGIFKDRYKTILSFIRNIHVFGVTKHQQPKHPLYLRHDLYPIPYEDSLREPNFVPIRSNNFTLDNLIKSKAIMRGVCPLCGYISHVECPSSAHFICPKCVCESATSKWNFKQENSRKK